MTSPALKLVDRIAMIHSAVCNAGGEEYDVSGTHAAPWREWYLCNSGFSGMRRLGYEFACEVLVGRCQFENWIVCPRCYRTKSGYECCLLA